MSGVLLASKVLRGLVRISRIPSRSVRNVYVPEQMLDLSVPTLKERLDKERIESIKFAKEKEPVDIGFPVNRSREKELNDRIAHRKYIQENPDFETKARKLQLHVDPDEVRKDWIEREGQFQIKSIASHYGVYEHLFGYAYFVPRVHLDIRYNVSDDEYAPVHCGNTLKPTHAKSQPQVTFNAKTELVPNQSTDETLWTLVLTNPDGHLTENDKEYVHWFVGNIPNGDVSSGETIVPYLQPFPPRGTGYHRHIFVLYKQDKKIDFSQYQVTNLNDLKKRTFKTLDFYKEHQDFITPAGLSFFQSDWDTNLTEFYHHVLEIKEPVFEYDFPKPYHPPERRFPLKQPFNLYLDRYRDPKEINKEFLVRELKKTDPFDGPEPEPPYPNCRISFEKEPTWLGNEKTKRLLNHGRINEIREEYR